MIRAVIVNDPKDATEDEATVVSSQPFFTMWLIVSFPILDSIESAALHRIILNGNDLPGVGMSKVPPYFPDCASFDSWHVSGCSIRHFRLSLPPSLSLHTQTHTDEAMLSLLDWTMLFDSPHDEHSADLFFHPGQWNKRHLQGHRERIRSHYGEGRENSFPPCFHTTTFCCFCRVSSPPVSVFRSASTLPDVFPPSCSSWTSFRVRASTLRKQMREAHTKNGIRHVVWKMEPKKPSPPLPCLSYTLLREFYHPKPAFIPSNICASSRLHPLMVTMILLLIWLLTNLRCFEAFHISVAFRFENDLFILFYPVSFWATK